MNLFTVNGELSIDTSNIYIDGSTSDLSIEKIKYSDYAELIKNNACLSNVLYIVESDYIDAYGEQIKNIADPSDEQDAVTLKYAKENFSSVKTEFDENKFVLKSEMKNLVKDTLIELLNT